MPDEGQYAEMMRRLAGQWPKWCGCQKKYETVADWEKLPFAYMYTDKFATQEARHCSCGSTLVVLLDIHDLEEE